MNNLTTTNFHLSPLQERIWRLQEKGSVFYSQCGIRLQGPLDLIRLTEVIGNVVAKHEILRTCYRSHTGRQYPLQEIWETVPWSLEQTNASAISEERQKVVLEQILVKHRSNTSWDERALFQTELLQLGEHHHLLVLSLPSLSGDTWTLNQIAQEIGSEYQNNTEFEVPNQYAQFAEWHHGELESPDSEALAFWETQEEVLNHQMRFSLETPHHKQAPFFPRRQSWKVPEDIQIHLNRVSQHHQCLPEELIFACWVLFIWNHTAREEKWSMGYVEHGREFEEFQSITGLFARTLPLGGTLEVQWTLTELIREIQPALQNLQLWQDTFPIHKDHHFSNPVTACFEKIDTNWVLAGDTHFSLDFIQSDSDHFLLKLTYLQLPQGLVLELACHEEGIQIHAIELLLEQFTALLEQVVANPDLALKDYSFLPEGKTSHASILHGTSLPETDPSGLLEWFTAQVQEHPEAIAVCCGDTELNYRQLNECVNRLSQRLCEEYSVPPGSFIGVMLPPDETLVIALLATWKTGCAFVPIDPSNPAERIAWILEDSGVRHLIMDAEFLDLVEGFTGELIPPVGEIDESAVAEKNFVSRRNLDSLAYMIYTSGTTGQPKGTMLSDQALLNYLKWFQHTFRIQAGDSSILLASYAFDLGYTSLWGTLLFGGTLHLTTEDNRRNPEWLIPYLLEKDISFIKTTPSFLSMLLHSPLVDALKDWLGLRLMLIGGEAIRCEDVITLQNLCPQAVVVNHYGPTEATIGCVAQILDLEKMEDYRARPVIGRPIAHTTVCLLDERSRIVPVGVCGEICIGGRGLAGGYWKRELLTQERFFPNPVQPDQRLYRTGDLGRILTDGTLEFLGRLDDQVKIRGFRVELGEIKEHLTKHPKIQDVVVLTRDRESGEKELLAYLIPTETEVPSVSELRQFLLQSLPEYMIPLHFISLKSIPLTPNGKVNKQALPPPESAGLEQGAHYVAPQTENEWLLCQVWKQVLEHERIGTEDNFFDLGGHSLKAIQLITHLQRDHQKQLTLQQIFEFPTVGQMAEVLCSITSDTDALSLQPLEKAPHYPVSHAQHRLWILSQIDPDSTVYNISAAYRLKGDLDVNALECSLQEMLQRHESLRTTFVSLHGEPQQQIHEHLQLQVDHQDLMSEESPESTARAYLRQQSAIPFRLDQGPLLRVSLLKLSKEDHVLFTNVHHIVFDEWSADIFLEEWEALYLENQTRPTQASDLWEPLQIQYKEFADWQNRVLAGSQGDEDMRYWTEKLTAPFPILDLPVDFPRPAVKTYQGTTSRFSFSPALTETIKNFSREQGTSLFITMTAMVKLLLFRYTGQDDIIVGTPVANRNHADLENQVGFYLNTLALRDQVNPHDQVLEFLQQVKHTTLEAQEHGELPFDQLLETVVTKTVPGREPLFDVMVVQNQKYRALKLGGLRIFEFEKVSTVSKYDIVFYFSENEESLCVEIEYSTDLFRESSILRLFHHLENLVEQGLANPEQRVDQLQFQTPVSLPTLQPAVSSDSMALSSHQERIWFIDEFERGYLYQASPIYHNIPLAYHLKGQWDESVLSQSLSLLLERHQVLQTQIISHDGEVHQVWRSGWQMEKEDLRQMSPRPWQEVAEQEANRPFDPHNDFFFRAKLFRLSDEEAVLVCTLHHLVADKWTLRLLAQELEQGYNALLEGHQPSFTTLSLQYHDFVAWQNGFSEDLRGNLLFYWKHQLGKKLQALQLPTDRPRPAIHTFEAGTLPLKISQTLSETIRQFSQECHIPTSTILLVGFQLLCFRYAQQEQIVVGTTTTRRPTDMDSIAGPLSNLLVLNCSFEDTQTVREILKEVEQLKNQAFAHWALPFDQLVLELAPKKDMSRTALFDVLFQFQDFDITPPQLTGLEVQSWENNLGFGKYDLNLCVQDAAEGFKGQLVYNQHLYDSATMLQYLEHYQRILEQMVALPDASCQSLSLLSTTEIHQQQITWNQTQAIYPQEATLHQLFEAQVRQHPDRMAVSCEEQSLCYRELNERANQLAHYLRKNGVDADVLVGVYLERSIDMVVALLGILKAGGAYVPIDPDYPSARAELMLAEIQSPVTLTQSSLREQLPANAQSLLCLDSDWETIAQESHDDPNFDSQPHHLAYLIFTSGSTGVPKGVMIEHRHVVRLIINDQMSFQFNENDVWTLFHSFCFDFSVWEMYGALLYGGKLVVVPKWIAKNTRDFLDLLIHEKVTILNQTPSAFYRLIEEELQREQKGLQIRDVIFGGEALNPIQLKAWYQRYPETRLINMFGITETTVHVTYKEITAYEIENNISNIGRPIPTLTLYLLDENQQMLPVGVPGELYVGGAGVARGYLNREELNKVKFVSNPFQPEERLYRTGDLARYLRNGELVYLGRIDHQVKIRGFRIELGEIETQLLKHEAIQQVAVIDRVDRDDHKYLCAYLVPSQPVTVMELRAYLAKVLADYMIPAFFVMLDELPMTSNGKVDREQLPEPLERLQTGADWCAPRSALEKQMAQIWKELLNLDSVSIHDDFFSLGGQSLKATRLVSRLQTELQFDVKLRVIFSHPTIASLCEVLTGQEVQELQAIEALPEQEDYPVSHGQRRLWVLNQLEEEHQGVYNMAGAFQILGPLDREVLEQSLAYLIQRHETLRTNFYMNQGELRQKIRPFDSFMLPCVDLTGATDPLAEARQRAEEVAHRPFNLKTDSLVRTQLFKTEEEAHVFLLTFHHIIYDGWSSQVFFKELEQIYSEIQAGVPISLSPLPFQYRDYAHWHQQLLANDQNPHLAYWRDTLSGTLPVLELPRDFPRPPRQTYEGKTLTFRWPAERMFRLRDLGQSHGGSLYSCLLALVSTLLYRYTGQNDFLIGLPVAGRIHPDLENQIGFYVNTVVLRSNPEGKIAFAQHLEQTQEILLNVMEHQMVPFDQIVEDLGLERDLSRGQLFDVMVDLINEVKGEERIGDLTIKKFEYASDVSKFDLSFDFSEEADELLLFLEYNTQIFCQERIERMGNHLGQLIEGVLDNAEQTLQGLPLLTMQERNLILNQFNNTIQDFGMDRSYPILFEERVGAYLNEIAVSFQGKTLTYQELEQQSRQLALALKEEGLQRGELVGVCMAREPHFLISILGILRAGGVYVPFELSYPKGRIRYMLEDSQVRILLLDQAAQEKHADLLTGETHFQVAIEVDEICRSSSIRDTMLATQVPKEIDLPENRPRLQDPAYMIYTSGTTGRPKGALVHHGGCLNHILAEQDALQLPDDFRFLQSAPVSSDISVIQFLAPILTGGRVVICDYESQADPKAVFTLMQKERVTVVEFVPSFLQVLLEYLQQLPETERALSDLQWLLVTGETASVPLVNEWLTLYPETKVLNAYGPSEASDDVIQHVIEKPLPPEARTVPIGKPLANMNALILDSQQQLLPVGVVGEIVVSGVGVGLGYWNKAAQTEQSFLPNPYPEILGDTLYLTGDLGYWLPDGTIEFIGRQDSQVKLRGHRIELSEIDSVMMEQDYVQAAAVVLKEDPAKGAHLAGYFSTNVINTNHDDLCARLRKSLEAHLPTHMIPAALVILDALPLTPIGKIDQKALIAMDSSSFLADQKEECPPRNALEKTLVHIWESVLGQTGIGIRDNFFDRGGHSLTATQILLRVQKQLSAELRLIEFFNAPTIEEMALQIQTTSSVGFSPIPVLPEQPHYEASHGQKRIWVLDQVQEGAQAYNMLEAYQMEGPLQLDVLEHAFNQIVARHEVLRTNFIRVHGEVRQQIQAEVVLKIPRADLRTEQVPEIRLEELLQQEAQTPFDLAEGPLIRVIFVQLPPASENGLANTIILLNLHHITADAWSMEILFKELLGFYMAEVKGESFSLPPLAIQYKDFAAWQKQQFLDGKDNPHRQYWHAQLENLPELQLSTDFPRPAVARHRGAKLRFALNQEHCIKLQLLATQTQVTPYTVMLTLINLLLFKLSGQQTIVIGSDASGRVVPELEEQVGFYLNLLVLKSTCRRENTFLQLLSEVGQNFLEAQEHQAYPFDLLVEEFGQGQDRNRNPFFDVAVTWSNTEQEDAEAVYQTFTKDITVKTILPKSETSKFDLTFMFSGRLESEVRCAIEYDTDLFTASRIEQFRQELERLIEVSTQSPESTLQMLFQQTLTEQERVVKEQFLTSITETIDEDF